MDQTLIAGAGGAVAFTSAALPAAGAYATGVALACKGAVAATFQCHYTRAAVGGKASARVMISIDGGQSFMLKTTRQIIGIVPPSVAHHQYVPEEGDWLSASADDLDFEIGVEGLRATHVRLDVAESGTTDTPGTFAADNRFYRGDGR